MALVLITNTATELTVSTQWGELVERSNKNMLGHGLTLPLVASIPPGNHRCDVQVLGPHQQVHLLSRTVNVQVCRPPSLAVHVDNARQGAFDLNRFLIG